MQFNRFLSIIVSCRSPIHSKVLLRVVLKFILLCVFNSHKTSEKNGGCPSITLNSGRISRYFSSTLNHFSLMSNLPHSPQSPTFLSMCINKPTFVLFAKVGGMVFRPVICAVLHIDNMAVLSFRLTDCLGVILSGDFIKS